jgi:hypothetical protein
VKISRITPSPKKFTRGFIGISRKKPVGIGIAKRFSD